LVYDKAGKKITGVTYVDLRTGEEYEQPAGLVALCGYVFANTQLMLLAGIGEPYDPAIGKGAVGRNYCYQTQAGTDAFFEDKFFNPFMQAGGSHTGIDDFNGDNFDHAGLGFLGGGYLSCPPHGGPPKGGRAGEGENGKVVRPVGALRHERLNLGEPQQLPRPRSDLQGRDR